MRILSALLLAGLLVALGMALSIGGVFAPATAAPAPVVREVPTGSPSPVWAVMATGEAMATQGAAAFTQVAEATRLAQQHATETQAVRDDAKWRATLGAVQITADYEKSRATQHAGATVAAATEAQQAAHDAATQAADLAQAAAWSTAAQAAVMATQTAQREQNATMIQLGAGLLGLGVQCAWGFAALAVVLFLLWTGNELLPVVKLRMEARARLITGGPQPLQAVGPINNLYVAMITQSPPILSTLAPVIEAPQALPAVEPETPPTAPTAPARLATHADDAARPLLWRVLNLLATVAALRGNDATDIPRYDKLGIGQKACETLKDALEQAGHVTVSNGGTVLTGGETVYSLWCKLSRGIVTLNPTSDNAPHPTPETSGESA